jgi:hypothetical protein
MTCPRTTISHGDTFKKTETVLVKYSHSKNRTLLHNKLENVNRTQNVYTVNNDDHS